MPTATPMIDVRSCRPVTGEMLAQHRSTRADGTLQFLGDDNFLGNTMVLGGTEGNDKLTAGAADDDTVWGDGGNDVHRWRNGNDFVFGGTGNDTDHRRPGRRRPPRRRGQRHHLRRRRHRHHLRRRRQRLHRRRPAATTTSPAALGNDIIIGGEGFEEILGRRGRRLDRRPRRTGAMCCSATRRADRSGSAL